MTAAKPRKTNTDIEQHYFERFRTAYKLPVGTLTPSDKPDVILTGKRKIGIEITNFYLKPGSDPESEQQQEPWRAKVVSKAQALYRAAGGKGIELTISFDACHPIKLRRGKMLPGELAGLAKQTDNRPTGPLERSLFVAMPEIASVYLNAREYDDAKWRLNRVYAVELMSVAGLEGIVREKEAKAAEYQPCDAYWLLVVVEGMDAAQEQEIRLDDLKISSDIFEKVIVYKPGFEHIIEVRS